MKTLTLLLIGFLIQTNTYAQNQTALLGQPNQIKFNIANVVNTNKCNIEVTLPNQQKVGVEVEGPQFIASVDFNPEQAGNATIQWEGKTKVRGLSTVFACPGSGTVQVQVNGNTRPTTQAVSTNTQSQEGKFSKNNQPQNLKLVAKTAKYDSFIDLNRKILNQDGSVTAEIVNENFETLADNIKSFVNVYTFHCNEKDEKRISYIENYKYTGSRKSGNLIEGRTFNSPKTVIKEKTVAELWFNDVCSLNVAQSTTATPQLSTLTQNTNQVGGQNSLKFLPKMRPEEINTSVIRKSMSEIDIDIFLFTYSFIWHINNWINQAPNDNYLSSSTATWWMNAQNQQHKEFSQFKPKIQQAMNAFEETIGIMASNTGLSKTHFKQSIGIIETDVISDQGRPLYKTLRSNYGGTKFEELNRNDITSNGIRKGIKEFFDYTYKPGTDLSKNINEGHPGTEMSPAVFFDYYTKWIPSYYLDQNRLAKLKTTAINLDNTLDKNAQDAEKAQAKRIEDEKKRQEFLNSPEGKRQIAKEQAEEKQRQIQYIKEFPFYAEITCNNGGYGYFPIHACFSKNNNILFEIRNGSDYKFYTLIDIMQLSGNSAGNQNSAGIIDLRNAFQIKMQNGGEQWILGLRVFKRQTNQVVFEKKVSGYGVISLSN